MSWGIGAIATAFPNQMAKVSQKALASRWHSGCQGSFRARTDIINESQSLVPPQPCRQQSPPLGTLFPGARRLSPVNQRNWTGSSEQFACGLWKVLDATETQSSTTGHITVIFLR